MSPSSRLGQGSFADLDLLLAENFIRAAEKTGVEHVSSPGGLLTMQTVDGENQGCSESRASANEKLG